MRGGLVIGLLSLLAVFAPVTGAAEDLNFRSISLVGGIFIFVVGGTPGTPYRLEFSTDLEDWKSLGEGLVVGGENPPAGFISIADKGPRYYLRLVRL